MPDYSIELIKDQPRLERLIDRLTRTSVMALDIETINWWNRRQEQIALIQIAFRFEDKTKVALVDALAKLDLTPLRVPLELATVTKAIHNAVFDASRLALHYRFKVAPVHDTMAAARRSGEKNYSLKAQAERHLDLRLDKAAQISDWSRRPLTNHQIHYAALDAVATLLLYENQIKRKLHHTFQLKGTNSSQEKTLLLPFSDLPDAATAALADNTSIEKEVEETTVKSVSEAEDSPVKGDLPLSSLALLGIITELSGRYHPDQLAVSVGSDERVGLAGWIVDRTLGRDTDLDEETTRLAIIDLCERRLASINQTRKLEATEEGSRIWRQAKAL